MNISNTSSEDALGVFNVVFDMETHDPDDYLTLLLLLGHPHVNLLAVTITPGTSSQVGLVRRTLDLFGQDIPVGAHNLDHPKSCVSSWHAKAYGEIAPSLDAVPGGDLLNQICDEQTTLITGGPLKNLGAALDHDDFRLGRLVAQGGFAGEGVVPMEKQLPKFKGLEICPTFNLNGDPKSALRAFVDPRIGRRFFVSKNVCHGVYYDAAFHQHIASVRDESLSMQMIWKGMDYYLAKKRSKLPVRPPINEEIDADMILIPSDDGLIPTRRSDAINQAKESKLVVVQVGSKDGVPICRSNLFSNVVNEPKQPIGKKLHDPLAACCAINPTIAQWAEVEMYRGSGGWGSRLKSGTSTWIIVDYDHELFVSTFTALA